MRATHLAVTALAIATSWVGATSAQTRLTAGEVTRKLAGTWKLVKYESFTQATAGNTPAGYDGGRIMYDDAGNIAAQLTRNGRPLVTRDSSDKDRLAAAAGYLAYFGKYEIDAAKGIVTHHVEGSTNTSWVGTVLVRYYDFSPDGNRLTLSLKNAEGRLTGTLTWERLR